jgi:hypothetical protein
MGLPDVMGSVISANFSLKEEVEFVPATESKQAAKRKFAQVIDLTGDDDDDVDEFIEDISTTQVRYKYEQHSPITQPMVSSSSSSSSSRKSPLVISTTNNTNTSTSSAIVSRNLPLSSSHNGSSSTSSRLPNLRFQTERTPSKKKSISRVPRSSSEMNLTASHTQQPLLTYCKNYIHAGFHRRRVEGMFGFNPADSMVPLWPLHICGNCFLVNDKQSDICEGKKCGHSLPSSDATQLIDYESMTSALCKVQILIILLVLV